jgi:hypothetical protein
VFIFLTVGFTVLGQILVKQGMLAVGASPTAIQSMPGFVLRALTNYQVVLGLGCAVIAALTWIIAISPQPAKLCLSVHDTYARVGAVVIGDLCSKRPYRSTDG